MYIFEIQKKMVCSLYLYKMFCYLCYILFILLYVYFNYKI